MGERIELTDRMVVDVVLQAGGDWLAADAARNSHRHGKQKYKAGPRDANDRDLQLLGDLTGLKHGSPFGHGTITFRVEAPNFVLWEMRTHKVGVKQDSVECIMVGDTTDVDVGYSGSSARYRPLIPKFWFPSINRRMIKPKVHNPMRPDYEYADFDVYDEVESKFQNAYQAAWTNYEQTIDLGVAPEVARSVMPVGVYVSTYISFNPLSLMRFLSLRIHSEKSAYPSYPQPEVEEVALEMEKSFREFWPDTWGMWNENGRLAF